jgi:DNA-3-methyladenine glycosylase I
VERLLGDTGIIRHRRKIEAAINNARRAVQMQADEGSVAAYIWRFEPGPGEIGVPQSKAQSATSVALSKDLRKRGWKFVGPTTAFAFMQSMGLVNDHQHECITRPAVESARRVFTRPS